jgi:peptidoglycan/LPS O-acetylase OafA/YrhL
MYREKQGFRSDINGLRAWAVLAVILYHFGIPGFAGGFVGVDIFFVISGFLMTGIILKSLESGALQQPLTFLLRFYAARAKRILPALLVLCAVLLCMGYFLLSATELTTLGNEASSAVLFFSNVKFWKETGYFAPNAHEIWLLHTWSLSVEWQFYMLLPLAMLAAWKLVPKRGAMIVLLVLAGVASLCLCLYVARTKPSTAFFLLPTRAWEMIAGGLVALAPSLAWLSRGRRAAFELGGFALITVAILGFGHLSWPDWHALVPVLGTVLVLLAARPDSPLTNAAPLQWIGNCSYSMYLWHWPLVVILHYSEQQASPWAIAAGLVLTAALGQLSFKLVETRLRKPLEVLPHAGACALLVAAAFCIVAPARLIDANAGYAKRLPPAANALFASAKEYDGAPACKILANGNDNGCMRGGAQLGVIVLGDSHGGAMFGAVAKALPDPALGAMRWTLAGCPSMPGVRHISNRTLDCDKFMTWVQQRLSSVPSSVPVLIINRTPLYLEGPNENTADDVSVPAIYFTTPYQRREQAFYREAQQRLVAGACEIAKHRPVYMLRPVPEMRVNVPMTMGHAMLIGRTREIAVSLDEYQQRTATARAAQDAARDQCGVKILDPLPYLCQGGTCNALHNGRSLYFDDNHLSTYGTSQLVPLFAQMFTERVAQLTPPR